MTDNDNLNKGLGTWGLTAFYVSSIVGVGILVVPGIAYQLAGPASLVSWLVLILVSFPLAYLFSRISMRYPNNGGIVYFIRLRFGKPLGQATGFLLTLTMIVGNPVMGIASARYFFSSIRYCTGCRAITGWSFWLYANLRTVQHGKAAAQ